QWIPVTHDFGLIRAPVNEVVRGMVEWGRPTRERSPGIRYRRRGIISGLGAALGALELLCQAQQRRLLVPTVTDWTAFFQNGFLSSLPMQAMSVLSRRLGVMAMRVCLAPHPAYLKTTVIWEGYAPPELGGDPEAGHRRVICSNDEPHPWTFFQAGDPFPFERTEAYDAPRGEERFPPEQLKEYLGHFGSQPFEDTFFVADEAHPAVLLDTGERYADMPEFTRQ